MILVYLVLVLARSGSGTRQALASIPARTHTCPPIIIDIVMQLQVHAITRALVIPDLALLEPGLVLVVARSGEVAVRAAADQAGVVVRWC